MTKRVPKYGFRYQTIKWCQDDARNLWYYNSIVLGDWIFRKPLPDFQALSAREIAHAAIQVAFTQSPERTRAILKREI